MQERVKWIDIAKAIGIFCIVLGHTVDEGALKQYVYSFHIPLFFFLSGATMRVGHRRFGAFAMHKAKTLLIPYAFFAVISQLVYTAMALLAGGLMQSGRSFSIAEGWLGIVLGLVEANRGLWFLPCLFLLSLLLYPVIAQLEQHPRRGAPLAAAIMLVSVLYTALDEYLLHIGSLPWKLDAAIKLAAFALGGWFFTRYAGRIPCKRSMVCLCAMLLLALGAVSGLLGNRRVMYLTGEYGNIGVFYLSSICAVLGLCLLLQPVQACPLLEYTGRHTLAILVMHKFPILFFEWVCPVVKGWMAAGWLPVELAVIAVSIALCCAAERILLKACPLVLGR